MTALTDARKTFRAIVVDDEPLARDALRSMLEGNLGVEVVAECANGLEACAAILEHRPDVLFLDIEMPELDGFATLERLEPEEVPPAVVFVTAFDQHALRAFDARALDYILKPVVPEKLATAVDRAARRVREARALRYALDFESEADETTGIKSPYATEDTRTGRLTRLVVRDHRGTTVVPVDDLEWIEAATYYVRLHRRGITDGRQLLLRERMHVLESGLDPRQFFRSHRSAIVRLDCVREISAPSSYEAQVVLDSGAKAPLSRDRRARMESVLRGRGKHL